MSRGDRNRISRRHLVNNAGGGSKTDDQGSSWLIGRGFKCVHTSVDLEGRRVEKPSAQERFEVGSIERMCGLVDLGDGSPGHG